MRLLPVLQWLLLAAFFCCWFVAGGWGLELQLERFSGAEDSFLCLTGDDFLILLLETVLCHLTPGAVSQLENLICKEQFFFWLLLFSRNIFSFE